MFRYFRVIPAALLTALLAVALVSCGGGEESVSSVAPSSSAVSAADPSEASATDTFSASSATLTSEEAPALTPAEDPYAVRRKMMVPADTEEGFYRFRCCTPRRPSRSSGMTARRVCPCRSR